jgi:glucose 1-dehydrogenase
MPAAAPAETATSMRGLNAKNVSSRVAARALGKRSRSVRFAEYGANVAINYLRQPEEAHDTEDQVHACVTRVRQEGVRDVLVQGDVSSETPWSRWWK